MLVQGKHYVTELEPREYPKLSVRLYGKGGRFLDAPTPGATVKMQRHQLAKSGQVVLSEIWGKKGAIGFVPPDGEGALCTSHFFLFDVRTERLLLAWLGCIFRANYLAQQLGESAFGTTGYAAVRPKDLMGCKIPLPPLPEQRRIVAKVEELAAKIGEANRLRKEIGTEVELITRNARNFVFVGLTKQIDAAPLGSVADCRLGKMLSTAAKNRYRFSTLSSER